MNPSRILELLVRGRPTRWFVGLIILLAAMCAQPTMAMDCCSDGHCPMMSRDSEAPAQMGAPKASLMTVECALEERSCCGCWQAAPSSLPAGEQHQATYWQANEAVLVADWQWEQLLATRPLQERPRFARRENFRPPRAPVFALHLFSLPPPALF